MFCGAQTTFRTHSRSRHWATDHRSCTFNFQRDTSPSTLTICVGQITCKPLLCRTMGRYAPKAWRCARSFVREWLKAQKRSSPKPTQNLTIQRQLIVERNLEQWPTDAPHNAAQLRLVNDPPRTCGKERVCVCLASAGMINVLRC